MKLQLVQRTEPGKKNFKKEGGKIGRKEGRRMGGKEGSAKPDNMERSQMIIRMEKCPWIFGSLETGCFSE